MLMCVCSREKAAAGVDFHTSHLKCQSSCWRAFSNFKVYQNNWCYEGVYTRKLECKVRLFSAIDCTCYRKSTDSMYLFTAINFSIWSVQSNYIFNMIPEIIVSFIDNQLTPYIGWQQEVYGYVYRNRFINKRNIIWERRHLFSAIKLIPFLCFRQTNWHLI